MTARAVARDERTIAIENEAYRWSYLLLSFGVLAIIAFRAFVWGEACWDLFALLILSGVVKTAYQARQRALFPRWAKVTLMTMAAAAVVAAILVFLLR